MRRKCTGAKHHTEAADIGINMVGERCIREEDRPRGLLESMEVRMPV